MMKRDRQTRSACRKLELQLELKALQWAETSVIRGQTVDDVITIAPTNLVLYILILPLLSHVDFPCNLVL